ncbi:MAG: RluA family pseudouridine synthase [Anaerolineaceae bacterium]|nr:RluA family pseudouridine synthase [Anaerolineaceae bacterium]
MAKHLKFTYDQQESLRIDKFLVGVIEDVSRARIQTLIAEGCVFIDDLPVNKSNQQIELGQIVTIEVRDIVQNSLEAKQIPLDVIFCDNNAIVINKPSGVVVHPGAGNESDTIVNAILWQWPEIRSVGEADRPGIVHRLDKETSGVLLIARTQKAYEWFVEQFKQHKTLKTYITLVDGHPPTPEGRIEAPIHRDPKYRQKMAVATKGQGRPAITEYFRIKTFRDHDLLEVHLLTGRTHQIRVHMNYIGCPVAGDGLYGRKKSSIAIDRFFLHASQLSICLPGEKNLTTFKAELAGDLNEVISILENQY